MSTSKPEITLRRLKRTDLFKGGLCAPWHVEGLTGLVDGVIVGYAGIQRFGVHFWAFFNAYDATVLRPFWLHRLVKDVLAAHDRVGITPIYSLVEATPGAERWHQVLGFRRVGDDEKDDEIRICEGSNNQQAWIRGTET